MGERNKDIALKYCAQAEYFIVAAELASKHSQTNFYKNPVAYKNFETVIVGTHHTFSAELLIKGIIFFHKGCPPEDHKIKNLLNHESCKKLKEAIKKEFQPNLHISYTKNY